MTILIFYLLALNLLGLLSMYTDKQKARRKLWRIPEATLMGIALAGGSLGSLAGMHLFRHKTRHPKFRIGLPVIFLIQLTALSFFMYFR